MQKNNKSPNVVISSDKFVGANPYLPRKDQFVLCRFDEKEDKWVFAYSHTPLNFCSIDGDLLVKIKVFSAYNINEMKALIKIWRNESFSENDVRCFSLHDLGVRL